MDRFQSNIYTINNNAETIFRTLSDLSNIQKIKDRIPSDKVSDLESDTDSISGTIKTLGKITFRIIEREPNKTIKFTSESTPFQTFMWIQLKQVDEMNTKIKLTADVDLNILTRSVASKPLQEGINKLAEILTRISY